MDIADKDDNDAQELFSYSVAICGCFKCLLSSSGSFGFCKTFD